MAKRKTKNEGKTPGDGNKTELQAKQNTRARTEIGDEPLGGATVLTPEPEQPLMGTGSAATWDYQPDPQVVDILEETENVETASAELAQDLRTHHAESPVLSGGDVDADWKGANDAGEETVGGSVVTPDQDRVDELGQALGLVYQDGEPLRTEDKLQKRDRERWELNPASRETEAE